MLRHPRVTDEKLHWLGSWQKPTLRILLSTCQMERISEGAAVGPEAKTETSENPRLLYLSLILIWKQTTEKQHCIIQMYVFKGKEGSSSCSQGNEGHGVGPVPPNTSLDTRHRFKTSTKQQPQQGLLLLTPFYILWMRNLKLREMKRFVQG